MNQHKFKQIPLCNVYDKKPLEHVLVDLGGPWTAKVKHTKTHKVTKQQLWALAAIDKAATWPEIVRIKEKLSLVISKKFDQTLLCQYPHPTRITIGNGG